MLRWKAWLVILIFLLDELQQSDGTKLTVNENSNAAYEKFY